MKIYEELQARGLLAQLTDAEEIKTDSSISDSVREAVEALSALGYGITEATRAVKAVKDAEQMAVEDILKASLKHLI